jgi:hypothetical protein
MRSFTTLFRRTNQIMMIWTGYVARMGEIRDVSENMKGGDHF